MELATETVHAVIWVLIVLAASIVRAVHRASGVSRDARLRTDGAVFFGFGTIIGMASVVDSFVAA